MDTQIDQILKQHIEWKDFCIDALKNDEFTLGGLDTTKNAMIKFRCFIKFPFVERTT